MDDKPADECWSEKQPWRRQERSLMGNPSRLHRGRPDGPHRATVLTRNELGLPRRMAHRPYPPVLRVRIYIARRPAIPTGMGTHDPTVTLGLGHTSHRRAAGPPAIQKPEK